MADLYETVDVLGQVALFASLSAENLSELSKLVRRKRLRKGKLLFSEGDRCTGFYIIAEGKLRIFKTSSTGREQLLAVESKGSSIAELPVFDGGPYPASVSALEDSVLLFISSDRFLEFCLKHPEVSLVMLSVVGSRLRRLIAVIEELSFTTIRQRLAAGLLRRVQGGSGGAMPGTTFSLGCTHAELANDMGTVRELISRNLARMQAEGLLRVEGQRITLIDPGRLQEIGSGN